MDYDELIAYHRLEKNTSKLTELPVDFFPELKELVAEEKKNYLKSIEEQELSKAANFSNLKNTIRELFALRQKKVLNKAIISVKNSEFDEEGLLDEEKIYFKDISKVLEKYSKLVTSITGEQKKKVKTRDLNKVSIRLLKEVPSFIGPDMKEYGPYEKNQVVDLPKSTAELLITRSMAEDK